MTEPIAADTVERPSEEESLVVDWRAGKREVMAGTALQPDYRPDTEWSRRVAAGDRSRLALSCEEDESGVLTEKGGGTGGERVPDGDGRCDQCEAACERGERAATGKSASEERCETSVECKLGPAGNRCSQEGPPEQP
jgi:hypothetical protein